MPEESTQHEPDGKPPLEVRSSPVRAAPTHYPSRDMALVPAALRPPPGDKVGLAFLGILLGAYVYAALLLFISSLSAVLNSGGITLDNVAAIFVVALMVLVGVFFFGLFTVTPVSMVAMGFTSLIAYTVVNRPPWPYIAGASGGLTGFLLTCWILAAPEQLWEGQGFLAVCLGPALATVMGQFGAVWTTAHLHYARDLGVPDSSPEEPPYRFGIRQIMIATAWVAGILTLLKLTSILGPWSAGIVACWFLYQAATLWIIIRVVRKVRGYE